jgi:hypothetical protein
MKETYNVTYNATYNATYSGKTLFSKLFICIIVSRRSKLRGASILSARKKEPPYPFKKIIISRKSTKIGEKRQKLRKISKNTLNELKIIPDSPFKRFLNISVSSVTKRCPNTP